jgi:DDE superfamily endonuclease
MSLFLEIYWGEYQTCGAPQAHPLNGYIELLYLPSYSPNLNLIERLLWKLVKKQCLYSKYYPDFCLFKTTISNFIDTAHKTHSSEMDSLLTLKFQTFDKAQVITV